MDFTDAAEWLAYNPDSGELRWIRKPPRSSINVGDVAGTLDDKGYRVVGLLGGHYKAHRLAWLLQIGQWPDGQIDHKNRVKGDNRWENLREVTAAQNAQNVGPRGRRSQFCGSHWVASRGHWHTHITVAGKRIFLGTFGHLLDAAAARISAENRLFSHHRRSA